MNPGHYGDQSYEQIRCWNVPPFEDQQGNNFIQPGATCSGGVIFHLPLYQTNYEDVDVAAQDPEVPLKPKAKVKGNWPMTSGQTWSRVSLSTFLASWKQRHEEGLARDMWRDQVEFQHKENCQIMPEEKKVFYGQIWGCKDLKSKSNRGSLARNSQIVLLLKNSIKTIVVNQSTNEKGTCKTLSIMYILIKINYAFDH